MPEGQSFWAPKKFLIFGIVLLIAFIAGVGIIFLQSGKFKLPFISGLTATPAQTTPSLQASPLPNGLKRALSTEASYPAFIQKNRSASRIVQEFVGRLVDHQGDTWTIESNNVTLSLTNEKFQNTLIEPKYFLEQVDDSTRPPPPIQADQIKLGQTVRITTITRIDSGARQISSIIVIQE